MSRHDVDQRVSDQWRCARPEPSPSARRPSLGADRRSATDGSRAGAWRSPGRQRLPPRATTRSPGTPGSGSRCSRPADRGSCQPPVGRASCSSMPGRLARPGRGHEREAATTSSRRAPAPDVMAPARPHRHHRRPPVHHRGPHALRPRRRSEPWERRSEAGLAIHEKRIRRLMNDALRDQGLTIDMQAAVLADPGQAGPARHGAHRGGWSPSSGPTYTADRERRWRTCSCSQSPQQGSRLPRSRCRSATTGSSAGSTSSTGGPARHRGRQPVARWSRRPSRRPVARQRAARPRLEGDPYPLPRSGAGQPDRPVAGGPERP